jgi:NAD-dependent DNA ligase
MKILPPTQCPSCAGDLVFENAVLYCRNSECPAQGAKKVENFAKTMKILGLGPKMIQQLGFTKIGQIYTTSEEDYKFYLGCKIGEKLYKRIQESKTASLNTVIAAAGIPLVGKTAADKLCAKVSDIYELTDELVTETLGPKTGESFIKWLEKQEWREWPFTFESEKQKVTSGKTVCITGRLSSFKTKAQAGAHLTGLGYKIVPNVIKDLDFLVNESGVESAKTKKARANGTKIINNIRELE